MGMKIRLERELRLVSEKKAKGNEAMGCWDIWVGEEGVEFVGGERKRGGIEEGFFSGDIGKGRRN